MSLAHFPPNDMEVSPSADERAPLVFGKRNQSRHHVKNYYTGSPSILIDPEGRANTQSWLPLVCVILAVMLERVAYYGILANLLVFLTTNLRDFDGNKSIAIIAVFVYTGMAWLMSTVGGFIGDAYSGRYNAIWGSLMIYIFGTFSLAVIAYIFENCHYHSIFKDSMPTLSLVTLLVLSVAEGAYKANISAFGAEQLSNHDDKTYRRFFNWFYWGINVSVFTAFTALAWIQLKCGFFIGYLIPFCCIFLACIIFCIPRKRYIVYPASGNILKKIYGVMKEACQCRKGDSRSSTCPGLEEYLPIRSWLDRAMIKYGGSYLDSDVEEVKTLRKISIIFVVLIPYWTIYFQMNSTFLLQGLHMNVEIESGSFKTSIPAAWLSLADVVFVLFLIPVMDKVVYPWLDRKGWRMSVLTRISIGFLFAVASMVVAGVVETSRYTILNNNNTVTQVINKINFTAANMPVLYQIPQYGLIGVSEVFASVGGLEFAYKEAPKSMQSFVMGLFFLVQSIGSLFGAGLYAFCSDVLLWISADMDESLSSEKVGRGLANYFYLLGGIMFVTWLIFIFVSLRCKMQFLEKRVTLQDQSRAKMGRSTSREPSSTQPSLTSATM